MGQAADNPIEVIDHIGAAGDGVVVRQGDTPVHVARTLPGESVAIRLTQAPAGRGTGRRAELAEVLVPSSDRVLPPCPHFAQGCGGCALQHWQDGAYAAWKRGLVTSALGRAGFAADRVAPLVRTPTGSRRRMDFAVRRGPGGVTFGLHRMHGTDLVDLQVCPVLVPGLAALLAPLRQLMSSLGALRREGSVLANLFEAGADLLIRTDGPLAPTDRAKLAAFAGSRAVARISWATQAGAKATGARAGDGPETVVLAAAPAVHFAGQAVSPPPGVFLQASAQGEQAIVEAVLAGLPERPAARACAVELFAGIGTLSFPLARRMRVLAYEGDAQVASAVRRAQSGSRVEMSQRDLARQPLSAKEMRGAAAVILDPPYGGAELQCGLIADSGVPLVIYVSCNPGALARDAMPLAGAGYTLRRATPIDQFVWSAQVECVAVFERSRPGR